MGAIKTERDVSRDLTVVKVTGRITAKDLQEWVSTYYAGTVTKFMVCDIVDADLAEIKSEDVMAHVQSVKKHVSNRRRGGKAAIVADQNPLSFGLGRMREIYCEMEDVPLAVRTFTTMREAMEWLGIKGA